MDLLLTGIDADYNFQTKLFQNNGQGNFTEMTNTSLPQLGLSSAAFSDVEGDGDMDLLLTGSNGSVSITNLYSNNGTGHFTLVVGMPFVPVSESTVAFTDIDNNSSQGVLILGTDYNDNSSTIFYSNNSTLSINDLPTFSDCQVYPNPTRYYVILNFKNEVKQVLIQMINVLGCQIYQTVFSGKSLLVNFKKYPEGVYFIQLEEKTKIKSVKY